MATSLQQSRTAMKSAGDSPVKTSSRNAVEISPRSVFQERSSLFLSKTFGSVDDFVRELGGKRVIRKVLIANNGIAAVKAIRSIKRWAYETFGDEHAIAFVAMATPEDTEVNAEYIHMADEVVEVDGGPNHNNYANIALIVSLARRHNVDAVWAGWGHASENPKLPDALAAASTEDHPLVWMGPSSSAMRALGDKVGSTLIAQSADVPCMPWSGTGLHIDFSETGIEPEVYNQACVHNVEEAKAAAARIGFPVMLKASEGGGGKGIRSIEHEEEIAYCLEQVQSEVPGSPIFMMKLASFCRHLEVQLLADEWGNVIPLFGRDCTVQRRHQKIIEEGPVVAAPPKVWREMECAAVRLAKTVNYVGAGTVEYLFMPDKRFYFLELNPRLQVEHPVTELISGVNLPAAQLQVAMGIPLHRIAGVRHLYREEPQGSSPIDFDNTEPRPPVGHVIACRITAENPDMQFQPTSGSVKLLNFRSTPNVWGYFSIGAGGGIHEFADSQFGHLFAHGDTRSAARRHMVGVLKELSIRGEIHTTVEFLHRLLEIDSFKQNKVHTTWLERLILNRGLTVARPDSWLVLVLGSIWVAHNAFKQNRENIFRTLERGQMPTPNELGELTLTSASLIYELVKYNFNVKLTGPTCYDLEIGGHVISANARPLRDGSMLVWVGMKKYVIYGQDTPTGLRLQVDGQTCLFSLEYDPTRLLSSMQGKLVRFLVENGAHVGKNDAYAMLEVMKMIVTFVAPEAGILRHVRPEGSVVEAGDLLATLELDHPERVCKAQVFTDRLPAVGPPQPEPEAPHILLELGVDTLERLLGGYRVAEEAWRSALTHVMRFLRDPRLPFLQLRAVLSSVTPRLPPDLAATFARELQMFERKLTTNRFIWEHIPPFPIPQLRRAIDIALSKCSSSDARVLRTTLQGVTDILKAYEGSSGIVLSQEELGGPRNHQYAVHVLSALLDSFFEVERHFQSRRRPEFVLKELRDSNKNDLVFVADVAQAHRLMRERSALVEAILDTIRAQLHPVLVEFMPALNRLASLMHGEHNSVALKAQHLIIQQKMAPRHDRLLSIHTILNTVRGVNQHERLQRLAPLVDQTKELKDDLFNFFDSRYPKGIQEAAIEVFVRRVFVVYTMHAFSVSHSPMLKARWEFSMDLDKLDREVSMSSPMISPLSPGLSAKCGILAAQQTGLKHVTSFHNIQSVRAQPDLRSMSPLALDPASEVKEESTIPPKVPLHRPAETRSNLARRRVGVMCVFPEAVSLDEVVEQLLKEIPDQAGSVVYCAVKRSLVEADYDEEDAPNLSKRREETTVRRLNAFMQRARPVLSARRVRRVTFIVVADGAVRFGENTLAYFTFRNRLDFAEDEIVRHIEPNNSIHLELVRLEKFQLQLIPSPNRIVHLFAAHPLNPLPTSARQRWDGRRFFARVIMRHLDREMTEAQPKQTTFDHHPESELAFVEALNAIEDAYASMTPENRNLFRDNHIFVNILIVAVVELSYVESVIRMLARRYSSKIRRLRVSVVEFAVTARANDGGNQAVRFVNSNPSGCVLKVRAFAQVCLQHSHKLVFREITPLGEVMPAEHKPRLYLGEESYHNREVAHCYNVKTPFMHERATAALCGTVFIYDFLDVFDSCLARVREGLKLPSCKGLFETMEAKALSLVKLGEEEEEGPCRVSMHFHGTRWGLRELDDPYAGVNGTVEKIGMVAWLLRLYTPLHPEGRDIVLIGNDITHKAGSFGIEEDVLFSLASRLARKRLIPRLYISSNSGARIGMAESVKRLFRAAWVDNANPKKGFRYLFLTPEDFEKVGHAVHCEKIEDEGETRHRLVDVVGVQDGIGVENLSGSGQIAGETSAAYDETFTLTYVSARSVGIGAYLARLGQRCIQKRGSPIILTGFRALNRLLGRQVYTSNMQLGGIDIMYRNGVSHLAVDNDLEGVKAMLKWLSFVPAHRHGPLVPTCEAQTDPIDREITFRPDSASHQYDPRMLLQGAPASKTCEALSGFFDERSFMEILSGWATTIVAGRARLGGLPVGVLAVETRTRTHTVPADPATPESDETTHARAGQVWFPDSAFKTAQVIQDLVNEDLPLIIFANWRGFSGGMRDMFEEVLKFGSLIVDALRLCKQPVFVYIPPFCSLRGGAWVVLDSTINSDFMEMYAAEDSRGGILEPEGAINVKFRQGDMLKTAHRLDATLQALDRRLRTLESAEEKKSDSEAVAKTRKAVRDREREVLPIYHQLAATFADLHDRPGRMLAKHVIRRVVPWARARHFFALRLRRRVKECAVLRRIQNELGSHGTVARARTLLHDWLKEDVGSVRCKEVLGSDEAMHSWLTKRPNVVEGGVQRLRASMLQQTLQDAANTSLLTLVREVSSLLENTQLSAEQRALLLRSLSSSEEAEAKNTT